MLFERIAFIIRLFPSFPMWRFLPLCSKHSFVAFFAWDTITGLSLCLPGGVATASPFQSPLFEVYFPPPPPPPPPRFPYPPKILNSSRPTSNLCSPSPFFSLAFRPVVSQQQYIPVPSSRASDRPIGVGDMPLFTGRPRPTPSSLYHIDLFFFISFLFFFRATAGL